MEGMVIMKIMPAFKDLTGQMFNNWKVIRFAYFDKHSASRWECECQCQNKTRKIMNIQVLKKSKDCGCSKEIDLTGKKIGRWTVIERVEDISYLAFPRKTWHCICECGTHRNIPETKLINNTNKNYSCGCARNYKGIQRAINNNIIIFHNDDVEIKLCNGQSTFIDKDEYELIKNDHWTLSSDGYAISSSGKFKNKRLHRVIMDCVDDNNIIIDHIDRDKLNNRKNNLRIVTNQENSFNQSLRHTNKSGVMGVLWSDDRKKWIARIKHNYTNHTLGYYDSFDIAVRRRLEAEIEYFGAEFAPQRNLFEKYGIIIQNNLKEAT